MARDLLSYCRTMTAPSQDDLLVLEVVLCLQGSDALKGCPAALHSRAVTSSEQLQAK